MAFGVLFHSCTESRTRPPSPTQTPAWANRAGVDVHEPLGSDVILYLTVGSHSIVARVDAHTAAKMGQQIEVVFNMRKMHLFDPQTQEAIV